MELRVREYKPHETKKEGFVDRLPIKSNVCTYYCKCNGSVFLNKCDLQRHWCRDVHRRWLRCLNRPKSKKVEVQVFLIGGDPDKRKVTEMSLQRGKSRAIRQIRMFQNEIIAMFTKVAKETNTNSINTRVKVDIESAIERVRETTLKDMPKQYGICDEINVCVSNSYPMTMADLVSTIMHESMHYICKVDRGYGFIDMCTRDEHEVFRRLGEVW